jgi:hypothetical protein
MHRIITGTGGGRKEENMLGTGMSIGMGSDTSIDACTDMNIGMNIEKVETKLY